MFRDGSWPIAYRHHYSKSLFFNSQPRLDRVPSVTGVDHGPLPIYSWDKTQVEQSAQMNSQNKDDVLTVQIKVRYGPDPADLKLFKVGELR